MGTGTGFVTTLYTNFNTLAVNNLGPLFGIVAIAAVFCILGGVYKSEWFKKGWKMMGIGFLALTVFTFLPQIITFYSSLTTALGGGNHITIPGGSSSGSIGDGSGL